jgi:hypothetical protein
MVAVVESGQVVVRGSHEMALLLKKLAAFERLVEEGEYTKAAVIADDLTQTIERFDPRVYFPMLFASFYKIFSSNIQIIDGAMSERGTSRWNILQDLYRVDLDSFVGEE